MDIRRHWSLDGFATDKIKLLQAISEIFLLRDESPILLLTDLKPEKELKFTHHRHFIFLRHHTRKFFFDIRDSTAKNNIIDINLTHKKIIFVCSSEKNRISSSWFEALLQKKILQCFIPITRCLLQPIEVLVQPVHHIRILRVFKTWWLHNIYFFFDFTVKKCTLYIHLI